MIDWSRNYFPSMHMWRENCITVFKIFKRDFPKVLKNGHSCLLLSGTRLFMFKVSWRKLWRFNVMLLICHKLIHTHVNQKKMCSEWHSNRTRPECIYTSCLKKTAFLSRVSTLTRDIDIAILSVRPSVCSSIRDVPVSDENGLTYRHRFFTIR